MQARRSRAVWCALFMAGEWQLVGRTLCAVVPHLCAVGRGQEDGRHGARQLLKVHAVLESEGTGGDEVGRGGEQEGRRMISCHARLPGRCNRASTPLLLTRATRVLCSSPQCAAPTLAYNMMSHAFVSRLVVAS